MAEGKRKARILASEADKIEQVNSAKGKAEGLNIVSEALAHKQGEDNDTLALKEYVCVCVFT